MRLISITSIIIAILLLPVCGKKRKSTCNNAISNVRYIPEKRDTPFYVKRILTVTNLIPPNGAIGKAQDVVVYFQKKLYLSKMVF